MSWNRQSQADGQKGVAYGQHVYGVLTEMKGATVEHDAHGQLDKLTHNENPVDLTWISDVTCSGGNLVVTYQTWRLPPRCTLTVTTTTPQNCCA